jgi:putative FmdB family regulatory protein
MPTYEYMCEQCGVIEIFHGMKEKDKTECPQCGHAELQKLISANSYIIWKGRQANQYNDCQHAKYWRDKDGNRHSVTASDGQANSPTTSSKRKRSDEEVKRIVARDKATAKQKRARQSYLRQKAQFERRLKGKK